MRQQNDETFLNRKLDVFGSDTSVATLIAGLVAASLMFGTAWISGLFSPIGISVIATGISLFFAFRYMQYPILDIFRMLIVGYVVFLGILNFISQDLPKRIINNDVSGWQTVIGGFKSESPVFDGGGVISTYEQPALILETNDFPVTQPVIPSQPVVSGSSGTVAAESNTSNEEYQKAVQIAALISEMNNAVTQGNAQVAESAALSILALEPNNPQAKAVVEAINQSRERVQAWQSLPPKLNQATIDQNAALAVRKALAGGSYIVISDGRKAFTSACKETSIVEAMTGFEKGTQFAVARCLLDQFNAGKTGDRFTVR